MSSARRADTCQVTETPITYCQVNDCAILYSVINLLRDDSLKVTALVVKVPFTAMCSRTGKY